MRFSAFAIENNYVRIRDKQVQITSATEPTDEMLAYIMHEVAEDARQSNEEALRKYFDEIKEMYDKKYGDKQ